ncbi:MAG: hypothetical protein CMM78_00115 [Rhodospirillaceae bacterium]|jgi:BASS family bile acid:Na+ symporter|uniref:hypothetical protein n=1 Tax=unclassified Hwanghaeella TaxID=2605944 RepID=UPI000C4A16B1|nr:hypothetical protein [Rhodospirillaceae bacterium]|tara:strand:- start:2009 stop:2947 length:939 start_codon:yes stop_codon:yes gene_type:complete
MLRRTLTFLARKAPLLLALGVCIGLIVPELAQFCRPALGPAVWLLLFLAALRIDILRSVTLLRRPTALITTLVWLLAVSPVLAWVILTALPPGGGLMIALILMAGGAPLMSTPSLAQLMGLDDTIALLVMIAATVLVPFTLPFIALHLLDLDLGIDPLTWSMKLSVFVGSAVGAAFILQKILGSPRIARAKEPLDLVIVFILVLFAIAIMDGVTARLLSETGFVLRVIGIAFTAYLLMLIVSSVMGRVFGARIGASIGFICANRNIGIVLAVLPAGSHPDIFLYFAIWQMPMYIMPSLLAPYYQRIFKPAPQ